MNHVDRGTGGLYTSTSLPSLLLQFTVSRILTTLDLTCHLFVATGCGPIIAGKQDFDQYRLELTANSDQRKQTMML